MSHVDQILEQWGQERPDLNVRSMGLTGRIKQLSRMLEREMEIVFAEHGLNLSNFDVLATLFRSGPPYQLRPGDLISNMMVTSGTMTNRIDQLVKAGLVERRRNPEDGRGFLIALTKDGKKLINAAAKDHVANLDRLTGVLSEREFGSLTRLLEKYLMALEQSMNAST